MFGDISSSEIIERAKEELEILEFEHPNRFQYLKMELRALIQDHEPNNVSNFSSALTQESSSGNKSKKYGTIHVEDRSPTSMYRVSSKRGVKRSGKTDAILERAQECLHKIQKFKTSL